MAPKFLAGLAVVLFLSTDASPLPEPVSVTLYGDSTNADPRFASALGAFLHAEVVNKAVGGTTSRDLESIPGNAMAVVNFGINDARKGVPLDEYRANLRQLYRPGVVFKTPSPVWGEGYDDAAYAQAMREVAQSVGAPLIDTYAFVVTVPDWQGHVPDHLHPDGWLYRRIAQNDAAVIRRARH